MGLIISKSPTSSPTPTSIPVPIIPSIQLRKQISDESSGIDNQINVVKKIALIDVDERPEDKGYRSEHP